MAKKHGRCPKVVQQIVHISDLHICKTEEQLPEVGAKFVEPPFGVTQKLVDHIRSFYPKAHIVITGDLTDRGSRREYKNAQKALRRIMYINRLSVVPGNHDCSWTRRWHPNDEVKETGGKKQFFLTFRKVFPGGRPKFPYLKLLGDRVAIIGLDSTFNEPRLSKIAKGKIGDRQLEALETILNKREVRKRFKVLLVHHHVISRAATDKIWSVTDRLEDAEELLDSVTDYGTRKRVDLILFGHRHHHYFCRGSESFPMTVASGSSVIDQIFRVFSIYDDGSVEMEWDSPCLDEIDAECVDDEVEIPEDYDDDDNDDDDDDDDDDDEDDDDDDDDDDEDDC